MHTYIGLIRKQPDSDYGVDFPDFPGCITAAATLDEAVRLAPEALSFHIRGMRDDGLPIPEPMAVEAIMADPENAGALPFVVTPPAQAQGRAIRVNITVEEYLLAEIDEFAERRGLTRSAFLAQAARAAMRVG